MPWSNGFMPKGSELFMISLAVVEGKDDLCPNHVTGLDASDRMRCYSWYRMQESSVRESSLWWPLGERSHLRGMGTIGRRRSSSLTFPALVRRFLAWIPSFAFKMHFFGLLWVKETQIQVLPWAMPKSQPIFPTCLVLVELEYPSEDYSIGNCL